MKYPTRERALLAESGGMPLRPPVAPRPPRRPPLPSLLLPLAFRPQPWGRRAAVTGLPPSSSQRQPAVAGSGTAAGFASPAASPLRRPRQGPRLGEVGPGAGAGAFVFAGKPLPAGSCWAVLVDYGRCS